MLSVLSIDQVSSESVAFQELLRFKNCCVSRIVAFQELLRFKNFISKIDVTWEGK